MQDEGKSGLPAVVRCGVGISGALAMLIGALLIATWLMGFGARWSAAGVLTVKTNTALAMVLAGLALLLLRSESAHGIRRWAGTLFSAVVMLIGALTLSEHLFGWDLGIDQLLAVEAPGAVATVSPNRMGPPASVCNTMIGIALLTLTFRRRAIVPYLGLAVCIINLVPAVGFLYGINQFYSAPHVTHIAWPTVIAMLSLGIGLMLSHTSAGPMSLLIRDDPGGALLRRLLPAALLIPLVLGFLHVQSEHNAPYDSTVSAGMLVLGIMLGFSVLLWTSAARLSHSAAAHQEAEEQIHSLALFPAEDPNPIMRVSADGELLYFNSSSEVLLRPHGPNSTPRLPDKLAEQIAEALKTGTMKELDVVCGDRVFSFVLASIANQGYVNLYGRDITKRKQAEQALREGEDRYRTLFSSMSEGFALHEIILNEAGKPVDYRFLEMNEAFERQTGLKSEDVVGKTMREVLPGDDPSWLEIYGKVALTEEPLHFDNYSSALDKWYHVYAFSPARGRFATLFMDITERKRTEEALRQVEAHNQDFYRRTILAATDGKLEIMEREQIEAIAGPVTSAMGLETMEDLVKARDLALRSANSLGMERSQVFRLLMAVGESTSNVVKHADRGTMSIHTNGGGLLIMVTDCGPGIDTLNLPDVALTMGFSTVGTGGMGYKMIIGSTDKVYLSTGPEGTTVAFVVGRTEPAQAINSAF